jgi:hypothetical protein
MRELKPCGWGGVSGGGRPSRTSSAEIQAARDSANLFQEIRTEALRVNDEVSAFQTGPHNFSACQLESWQIIAANVFRMEGIAFVQGVARYSRFAMYAEDLTLSCCVKGFHYNLQFNRCS